MVYLRAVAATAGAGGLMVLETATVLVGLCAASLGLQSVLDLLFR